MPVTQTDVSPRPASLPPPVDPPALVSTAQPGRDSGPADVAKPDGAREPFDFNEYIELLQYAEWGWF